MDAIEFRPINDLKAHARNARTHSQEQIEQLKASFREFGWTNPLLVAEDGTIIAGHGRWEAAKALGEERAKVIVARDWPEEKIRAYMIADNKLALNAGWDQELLAEELGFLADDFGMDLSVLGFASDELLSLQSGGNVANGQSARSPTIGSLAEQFGVAPFSVLHAARGWWQARKAGWLALGIQSEIGRGANLLGMSPQALFAQATGTDYDTARNIVAAAMETEGEGFDLEALIAKHRAPGVPEKKRKGKTYADELVGMVAEGKAEAEGRKGRKADAIPGGGGGPNSAHRKFSERMSSRHAQSYGAAEWVREKIDAGDLTTGDIGSSSGGTSIFDPVLCELAYRWFCPPGGLVYDPFAGGSVRGIVAAKLGRRYFGVDLRPEQIEANRLQAERICRDCEHQPEWLEGDSAEDPPSIWTEQRFDFLFSCPPYGDLEVYSDDPRDISTMPYAGFLGALRLAIHHGADALKDDRFACFVVGDFRDRKTGAYRGFIGDVIQAFEDAGLLLYNEAILVTAAGSLPIRVRKQFESARKLGKTHQNVLVFVKGDPKKASAAIGQVEFGEGDPLETESTEHGERLTSIGGEI